MGVHIPALYDPNVNLQRKLSANALLSTLDRASSPISPNSIGVANVIHSFNVQTADLNMRLGLPITFYHQGRTSEDVFTLYAPNEANLKSWVQAIQKQRNTKLKRQPAFDIVNSVKRYEFFADIKAHHMTIFGKKKKKSKNKQASYCFIIVKYGKIKAKVIYWQPMLVFMSVPTTMLLVVCRGKFCS